MRNFLLDDDKKSPNVSVLTCGTTLFGMRPTFLLLGQKTYRAGFWRIIRQGCYDLLADSPLGEIFQDFQLEPKYYSFSIFLVSLRTSAGMASSRNGRGMGVVYTVEEGGKGIDRRNGGGRGEQGVTRRGERGVNGERGTGRRGRELVCTCSARERIRRSIGPLHSLRPFGDLQI